jgi:exodeoxyribonuclease VII large subunit
VNVLRVGDLAEFLDEVISDQPGLQDVWVEGEVADCKVSRQGHCYLTLKDERASLQAVAFRLTYNSIRFQIQPGMMLLVHGKVQLYKDRSQVQLILDSAQPSGVGDLFLAFEQLRKRLESEGLFAAGIKRPLPAFPRRVGIVTSESGAALRDVIKVLRRRCPVVPVLLAHAPVQGEVASAALVRALRRIATRPGVDVVLLVRGGGSIEDLASFNDETLARAIRACQVPVVVGVGHETDFTIADFAADIRASTPSMAAELAVPDLADLRRQVLDRRRRLSVSVSRELEAKREQLRAAGDRLVRQSPALRVPELRQRLDERQERLGAALRAGLDRARRALAAERARLEALSPMAVLSRGYSLARDESGAVVMSVAGLVPGRRLTTVFADGSVLGEVIEVHGAQEAGRG